MENQSKESIKAPVSSSQRSLRTIAWTKILDRRFFAVPDGYPTTDDFNQVVNTFISAADEWNKINFGVTISRTLNRRDANFLLSYQAKPSSSTKWPPLASAFIGPHKVSSVKIYGLALTSKAERDTLKTALLHEIGHVLGLRHELEFKPDTGKPPSGTTLQILAPNPNSVMNGEKRNGIQQSDINAIKEFYKKADGWVLPGSDVKIKDSGPTPLPVKTS